MQVILKQSEITAALAAYMVNVLGATGVTPETLNVVYKQGRSDKNGMTAELEIEAPTYERPKADSGLQVFIVESALSSLGKAATAGNDLTSGETAVPVETTYASAALAPVAAPVEAAVEPEVLVDNLPEAKPEPEVLVYEGERRAEDRAEETTQVAERVAELDDEVAAALAEDEAADAAEAQLEEAVAAAVEPVATPGAALFS